MTLYDTRLPDPTAKAVHEAIASAFRAVGKRGIAARIPHTKIGVKRVADRAAGEPEGVEFWASREAVESGVAGQVAVAWWTAASGRRHVRVTGRLVTPSTRYLLNGAKLKTRPAVWHVFPDRVYRRRAGTANDLVAVCGCGAVGTEKALGWAGPCCGPCADYREEHGALPWARPALFPTPTPCRAVAASADGRRVATVYAGGAEVRVWDVETGRPVYDWKAPSEDAEAAHIGLSADGRFLALAGRANRRLHVLDLDTDPVRGAVQWAAVWAVAFHPVRAALYFVADGSVLVSEPPDARAQATEVVADRAAGALLAFSPDGGRLAVRVGQGIATYEPSGAELTHVWFPRTTTGRLRAPPGAEPHAALSPDGGQLAIGYDYAVGAYHAVTGAQRFADGALEAEVSGVAFDPGGKWLYVGRRDGTLVAYHTDTFAKERGVVFRWTLGPIHALATCGDSLLTACDEGAQLWPMAKLLEGA